MGYTELFLTGPGILNSRDFCLWLIFWSKLRVKLVSILGFSQTLNSAKAEGSL